MAEIKGGQQLENVLAAIAKKLKGGHVRVGFLEGSKEPDGTPIALVAAVQNFGSPARGIPPRPFFTDMIKTNAPNWPKLVDAALQASDNDTAKALEIVGSRLAGQLIQSIEKMNSPPLSEVTLLLRQRFPDRVGMTFADVQQAREDVANGVTSNLSGSGAKPLVWTGAMRQSLQGTGGYEVVMDGSAS